MRIFVDASALVAIIQNEAGRPALLGRLQAASQRLWSALSCWEAVSALQSSYGRPIGVARQMVAELTTDFGLDLVSIGQGELQVALDAYQTYGKGRHRARLNFGDCFAYACAKTNGARLLYTGHDFTYTDLA